MMGNFDSRIREIIEHAVSETRDLVRKSALEDMEIIVKTMSSKIGGGHDSPAQRKPKQVREKTRRTRVSSKDIGDRILVYLSTHPGSSLGDIASNFGLKPIVVARTLRRLRDEGRIKMEGTRRTAIYSIKGKIPQSVVNEVLEEVVTPPEGISSNRYARKG